MPDSTVELSHDLSRLALESLVVDNPDLERLETSLDQFNVFEALGVVGRSYVTPLFWPFYSIPKRTMVWATNLQSACCRRC
jgi:hypothetical protein